MKYLKLNLSLVLLFCLLNCKPENPISYITDRDEDYDLLKLFDFDKTPKTRGDSLMAKYALFELKADLSSLTPNEQKMIPLLMEASEIMDKLFWIQSFGDKGELLDTLTDPSIKAFTIVNYGPWDRLDGNKPFIKNYSKKPQGANFYPSEMIREELEQTTLDGKDSLYTMIRRNQKDGSLYTIPYHKFFEKDLKRASFLLEQASSLADDPQLKKYLALRAEALITDEYKTSDLSWLEMKNNKIDIVIGPIETYEDQLFGYKAAYEAYVLVKDMEWSRRLSKYTEFLPELQRNLPVPDKYKEEQPGLDTELNAYDVIYYSGNCNAGSKTIAINLPNAEDVQLEKGTRRLQLKNVMQAKFEKILLPISELLIDDTQRKHITSDAFFTNTMFHEVAHGLGIKNTIDGKSTVRLALKENASIIEESKADILGIYIVQHLLNIGELQGDRKEYLTTFIASIFRSIRFGASSAHGKANMIRFNYLKEKKALKRDSKTGKYKIDFNNLNKAIEELTKTILVLQGDGNYNKCASFVIENSNISSELQSDLSKLNLSSIPIDLVFAQGRR